MRFLGNFLYLERCHVIRIVCITDGQASSVVEDAIFKPFYTLPITLNVN